MADLEQEDHPCRHDRCVEGGGARRRGERLAKAPVHGRLRGLAPGRRGAYILGPMDLVRQVMANLEVDEAQAERGIGAMLMALRMSVDESTFTKLKQTIHGAESMMGRSLMSGGRTGEMAMMAGPGALMVALTAAGFEKDDAPRLARLVLEFIRPTIGGENVEKFYEQAPALKG